MPEPSVRHDAIINAIMANAGRSTLPFQQAHADRWHGTAFWFNDLLDSASGSEVISQYLVTAAGMTRYDLGELTLRPELCEPGMSAEKLLMTDFAEGWTVLGDLGVAVMPTAGLHAHGRRKGWSWTTDEITDGLAARHEDIARIGAEPRPAYILGHDVGEQDGERLQAVVVGRVARGADGHVHWDSTVPEGAPVLRSSWGRSSGTTGSGWSASDSSCPAPSGTGSRPSTASGPRYGNRGPGRERNR
ncbi:hypothetical protein [Streptomyces sp. NPDC005508]|uniref:hypothetical protein n=1 Tax=Streptomyces sp. NPDC005508 TaxID=3154886 RepID=UPI00339EF7C9